jgi:hypothetical protein
MKRAFLLVVFCAVSASAEIGALRVERDGASVRLSWATNGLDVATSDLLIQSSTDGAATVRECGTVTAAESTFLDDVAPEVGTAYRVVERDGGGAWLWSTGWQPVEGLGGTFEEYLVFGIGCICGLLTLICGLLAKGST